MFYLKVFSCILHKSTIGHIKTYLGVMDIEFLTELQQRREGEKGLGELTQGRFVRNILFASNLFKKLNIMLDVGSTDT